MFTYALLFGILISGISYYGIEYFLQKFPEKHCNSQDECILKEIPISNSSFHSFPEKQEITINNIKKQDPNYSINSKQTNYTVKTSILLILFVVCVFLLYCYFYNI